MLWAVWKRYDGPNDRRKMQGSPTCEGEQSLGRGALHARSAQQSALFAGLHHRNANTNVGWLTVQAAAHKSCWAANEITHCHTGGVTKLTTV